MPPPASALSDDWSTVTGLSIMLTAARRGFGISSALYVIPIFLACFLRSSSISS